MFHIAEELQLLGHQVFIIRAYGSDDGARIYQPFVPVIDDNVEVDLAICGWWPLAQKVMESDAKWKGAFLMHDERINHPAAAASFYLPWQFWLVTAPWVGRVLDGKTKAPVHVFNTSYERDWFYPRDNKVDKEVVFFSRWQKRKNPELGYAAMNLLKKRRPDIKIVTFDSDPLPAGVVSQFSDRHERPTKNEMGKLFSEATVYVQAAREGYGTLVLEAGASGTPSVTPDRDGCELFPEGSVLLADEKAEDIVEKVIQLVDNADMREAQTKKILEFAASFTWTDTTKLINDFITKVCVS